MMKSRIYLSALALCLSTLVLAQERTAEEIVKEYRAKLEADAGHPQVVTQNHCQFIWDSGKYVLAHPTDTLAARLLLSELPDLSLTDTVVVGFMKQKRSDRFVDYHYMLRAMKRGDGFEASRDGLSFSTQFPVRKPNHNDIQKLKDVFTGKHPGLHEAYMKRMPFVFKHNGCMKEMLPLLPLIEQNVAETPTKQKVLGLYKSYAHLMDGQPAPLPVLKDVDGKEHTFAEFKGKLVVVDVWASWCHACLEKMPKFMELRDEFKENERVVFLTISIDRQKKRAAWLASIEKHGMQGQTNWYPDSPMASDFENRYMIDSVPRYLLIDGEGNIVTAFAPAPGEDMKQLILEHLK